MLLPPLLAAGVALILAFRRAPPVAYVAGTMGALIGADLLNLGRVAEMGAPMVSIRGGGNVEHQVPGGAPGADLPPDGEQRSPTQRVLPPRQRGQVQRD